MASPFIKQFTQRTKSLTNRSTKKYLEEALYRNILKDGCEEQKVRQHLNKFLKSHKKAYKWEVGVAVKLLRERKLYEPALKLSETMSKRGMNKTVSDQAIHLDLIAKSRGIAAAETFFMNLPETSKNHLTYGALLNCYCKELMIDKAEALLEKMKELNLALSSMPYNSLMTLYAKSGQPEKVTGIIQEMKIKSIVLDSYTYNVWMRALADGNDISGVERVVDEIKGDGQVSSDWTVYSNLASIYVDAGLFDKAEKALKELEKVNAHQNLSAYQFLITLYGRTGNLFEVYRVWRSLRLAFPKTANISYLNMIQVLVNLKDISGAEKCCREWESGHPTYDIRIVNALIRGYTMNGMIENARELRRRARMRGVRVNAKTWEIFLDYYLKNGEIESAVKTQKKNKKKEAALKCVRKAVSIGREDGSKWIPSSAVVSQFMEYFEERKDVKRAEAFVEMLKNAGDALDVNVFESLIRTYAAAGRTSPVMRHRIKMENVELSMECKRLLDAICPE